MKKLFADDLELWGTLLPGVLFIPLVVVLGAPAGVLATALIWLACRSVGVIFATTPDARFDPAEASARTMRRLARTVPEGRPFGLAEALANATAGGAVTEASETAPADAPVLAEAS